MHNDSFKKAPIAQRLVDIVVVSLQDIIDNIYRILTQGRFNQSRFFLAPPRDKGPFR